MATITLQLPDELMERLQVLAAREGRDPNRVALDIIEKWLNATMPKRGEAPYEEWRREFLEWAKSRPKIDVVVDDSRETIYEALRMDILVDANILIRLANAGDPQQSLTVDATDKLWIAGHDLCIVPQDLYEFWSVATRPSANNGLGLSLTEVQREVARFKRFFVFFDDRPAIFAEWEKLVTLHGIVGKKVHDARLVAAMTVHGITHLLTFNKQDFQRFTNITALTPADVMAIP